MIQSKQGIIFSQTQNSNVYNQEQWKMKYEKHLLFYRYSLYYYLNYIFNINILENEFEIQNDCDLSIAKDLQDDFQKNSPFKYIYIRNKICLERLNLEEIEILDRKYEQNIIDEEMFSFIKKTLRKVITYDLRLGENALIPYHDIYDGLLVKNTTLLLVFQYDVFKFSKVDNYMIFFNKIQNNASDIKKRLLSSVKKDLGIDIEITNLYYSKLD